MSRFTFYEFFAGGGMARAGLGDDWRCAFANDFDAMKVATYEANWGRAAYPHADVATLTLADLPADAVDLAWASFPCQDLSLAGGYRGLGRERDNAPTRSGTFWPFWRLMRGLVNDGRAPRAIVLENVYGCLTSQHGQRLRRDRIGARRRRATGSAPSSSTPRNSCRNRGRACSFIAVAEDEAIPDDLVGGRPLADAGIPRRCERLRVHARTRGEALVAGGGSPPPPARNATSSDIIETRPTGVRWHTPEETRAISSA